jgi:hypothetical protein
MNITAGDILSYNSGLWIAQDFILRNTSVDNAYLRVAKVRANKSTSEKAAWKHETLQSKCYFSYSNLPQQCCAQLPDINTLQGYATRPSNDIEDLVKEAVWNGYKLFLSTYAAFPFKKSQALAQSAAIIHEAKNYIEIKGISFSKSIFFEQLAREIELQGIKYLPKSWRNLRDKVRAYAAGEDIKTIIRPKNEGNANAAGFKNNDLIKGWLIELADTQRNYSSAFIYRKIRLLCEQSNIEKYPSIRWVSDFMAKPETKYLISSRYGANSRFNQNYRGYTPTQTALYAGDCWQIDGTRVNIIDHRGTWKDKDDKKKTGQKFLYIIAVRDVMSGMPLGWEYCYEESAQAVINALAMAVRNAGCVPYELVYDRFPGHNTMEWAWIENNMRSMGTMMTITHKAEGKANIERWWGTLQSVFMSESDLYYGEGVKSSRRSAHRSKEYVTSMRQWALKNGFNFDDAVRETDKILNAYINTPYKDYSRKFANIDKSPLQLYNESDKPHTKEISEPVFCYLFGLQKHVSIRNYMIQTQIENADYYYGIDDCDLVEKYTGVKLLNCFDYEDLSRVHLFDGNTYLGTFFSITPAQRFGPAKDMRAVGKAKKLAADNEQNRQKKLKDIAAKKEVALQEPDEEFITSEVGLLQGGRIKKPHYEAAETAYLREQWEADESEIKVKVRNLY